MKKRADGRYQLSIMVGYNENGSPKRKLVYGKTQKEVTEKATDVRMKRSMGLAIDSAITIGEWATTWFDTYKSGVEYKTREMYSIIIKNYIVATIGSVKLKDVKTAHLQKIVNENSEKSWIVKKFKITVTQIFEQAINNDILFKNPAKGLVLPVTKTKHIKRALTECEQDKILSLSLDIKTKCYVLLLLFTGMRKSEALAITKNDINFDNMTISVNKNLVFMVNKSIVKDTTKTEAGIRTIPILEPLKETLLTYTKSCKSEFLFTTTKGDTFTDTAYRRMWAKFEKAIGTRELTAHIFRHNFATILYNAGIDIKTAQNILGHKSILVTMDIYTHLDKNKKIEATEKLNSFLVRKFD
ncbi:MAG: site-specific integrase [Defluviitaleaceae bacterium]|nr:site-specific integrase [Defluviitaleaceae bacterium]